MPGRGRRYPTPVSTPAPPPCLGLRHAALRVRDPAAMERFFVEVLGYHVEWRPSADEVYLRRAADNVALHRASDGGGPGLLDHLGLAVARPEDVDAWAAWLEARGAELLAGPRAHRDGSRSLYVRGPEGIVVQIIHHEPLLE